MTRDELDKAYRDESEWGIALHEDARSYVLGRPDEDVTPAQFLNTAFEYGKARMERERLQDELWGGAA